MSTATIATPDVAQLGEVAAWVVREMSGAADYLQIFAESTLAVSVESMAGAATATFADLREGLGCLALRDGRWRYLAVPPGQADRLADWAGTRPTNIGPTWSSCPDTAAFKPSDPATWQAEENGSDPIRALEIFTHRRYAVADTDGNAYAGATQTLRRCVEADVEVSGRRYSGRSRWLRQGPTATGAQWSAQELVQTALRHALDSCAAAVHGKHRTPVVFGPSAAAGFLHELLGHALEADNFQLDSPYIRALRQSRALPTALVIRDDPAVENGYGSYPADDEGHAAAAATLMADGEIGSPLTSMRTAQRGGHRRTANARRTDFRSPAIPRASNTVVLPGTEDPKLLLEDQDSGVLHVGCLGAGMIYLGTGEFSFAALDCHYVTPDGHRIPARDVSLVGNALEALTRLEGIGSDFGGDNVTCGKQGQLIGIGLYSPSIRYAALDWSAA
ncbi:TldD/PmbA family protein [Catenulispora pinisilvae]|uniref:TldD/PmbA family protein n=1 Tax=Catenulispora pinisilvae TaxID=2705253 RepID=UPI001891274F|nr:TldD/PmbA family protein [Catenulispora pinisilvae]